MKPVDVADRLTYAKRHWFHGAPHIRLLGDDKTFGKLLFDFGDETVIFNIYIMDRDKILDAAHTAIAHFSDPEHEVFRV